MTTNALVALASAEDRAEFYKKTYLHVAMAVLGFIAVESFLLETIPQDVILAMVGGRFVWLFIIGAFWLASMLANRWTMSQSRNVQYAGLAFYVLLEAVIFLPIMYIAMNMEGGGDVVMQAGILTLALFAGLTGVAFTSGRDFSFLRSFVVMGGFIALGLIVAGSIFSFNMGLWFSVGMILLATASILYQTNQLKNTYSTEQYVGAALQLFSSIMLLFWYVLRIFLGRRR